MNFKGFMLFLGIRAILGNVAKRPISCFLQEGACGYKMKAEAIFFSSEWGNAFHEPANTKHRSQTAQQALASFPTYSLRRGAPSANLGTSPERYLCVRHMKKIFRLFAGENRTCELGKRLAATVRRCEGVYTHRVQATEQASRA